MIKFVNRLTGTVMWVADERKNEYIEAGHKLASPCVKPIEEKPIEEKPIEPVKKAGKPGRPKKK